MQAIRLLSVYAPCVASRAGSGMCDQITALVLSAQTGCTESAESARQQGACACAPARSLLPGRARPVQQADALAQTPGTAARNSPSPPSCAVVWHVCKAKAVRQLLNDCLDSFACLLTASHSKAAALLTSQHELSWAAHCAPKGRKAWLQDRVAGAAAGSRDA